MRSKTYEPVVRPTSVPPRPKARDEVKRLKGKESLVCLILSETIDNFEIHFDPCTRRSCPHLADKSACEGCEAELPRKYRGYIHIFTNTRGKMFVELTLEAANQLTELFPDGELLRGRRVRLWRTEADNGRLNVERLEDRTDLQTLPPAGDVLPLLWELWTSPKRKRISG